MTAAKKPDELFFADVHAPEHPKFKDLANERKHEAISLWFCAGCWSKENGTKGRIPFGYVSEHGYSDEAAAELTRVNLWRKIRGKDEYQFHDWETHQRAPQKPSTKPPQQMALFNPGRKSAPPITYWVLKEFARLYKQHYGAAAPEATPANKRAAMIVGAWSEQNAAAQKLFPEKLVTVMVEGLFADPSATQHGFPLAWLASNPMRYLQPTAAKSQRGPAPVPSREEYELAASGDGSCF